MHMSFYRSSEKNIFFMFLKNPVHNRTFGKGPCLKSNKTKHKGMLYNPEMSQEMTLRACESYIKFLINH